jgi:hypothetical protein
MLLSNLERLVHDAGARVSTHRMDMKVPLQ